ncbi:unnamed protein product [Effrenium voratum]|uniref:Uncharacterized protein n=1 Tax=Effrenium voratum TaxID=2562239 RepID=A0AA36N3Y0_9DINO|nr:unnamed protein product [Effrenium voratum]
MLGGVVLLLHHLLFPVSGQISLVCSGVSSQAPGRVTFFFLSRSPPSASVGGVQVKDVSGLVYTQNFATCGEVKPGEGGLASTSTVAEIGTNIRTSCSSVLENGLPLIDATATDTNKITCYKRLPDMPSLDVLDGGFFHVLAHGETDETAILIPAQLTDRIRTIWAVAIDGFGSGWLALSQALDDGATEMAPCADVLTRTGNGNNAVTTRDMWPCSVGLTGRWWYFQVGPAGGLAKCSSAPSGNVVRGDLSSSRVQSFCSDVPDGFLCPVACDASYVPTGSIRCQDGVWSNTFVCRSLQTACLSPITTAQVESANGRESWLIRGIQPDQQGDCGLFTRLGKKCGATCREGEFGQGQVHCVGGGGGNPNSLQVPSGRFKAETGFDCIPQVSDSMFPAPVMITALTPVGDAIRVAATVTRDPNTVRSPIQQLTIRSVSGAMSCSVDRTGMSLSRRRRSMTCQISPT